MGRPPEYRFSFKQLANGKFFLQGRTPDEQVRRIFKTASEVMTAKAGYEKIVADYLTTCQAAKQTRVTRLTEAQIEIAEAARVALGAENFHRLVECVNYAKPHLIGTTHKEIGAAVAEWKESMERLRRRPATYAANANNVDLFIKETSIKTVAEITPEIVEAWVLNKGLEQYSQVGRGSRLRTFFSFCKEKNYLAVSPMKIKLGPLADSAQRKRGRPQILTPEECIRLLRAAQTYRDGSMVLYVILATWCFMRPSEVRRTIKEDIKIRAKGISFDIIGMKPRTAATRTFNAVPANVDPLLREAVGKMKPGQTVFYTDYHYLRLRERAGLLTREERTEAKRHRKIKTDKSLRDVLRHSGLSYYFNLTSNINETTRLAGNSVITAFKHYLNLPEDGDVEKFYAPLTAEPSLTLLKEEGAA